MRNNSTMWIINNWKFIVSIGSILFGAGVISAKVDNNSDRIAEMKIEVRAVREIISALDLRSTAQRQDINTRLSRIEGHLGGMNDE